MIFKSDQDTKKFKDYWVDCVVDLDKGFSRYDFCDYDNYGYVFTKEVKKWLKENKIKFPVTHHKWIRFSSADDAMAFKLAWI